MTISKPTSQRPVSGSLSASVKKRPVLYISETDPRNNKEYINAYSGEIKVLPEQEYYNWLKKQYTNDTTDTSTDAGVDNTDEEFGTLDASLPPPTSLKYDKTSAEDTKWVVTDGQVSMNIVVTFDESLGYENDESVQYYAHFEPYVSPAVTPTTASASTSTTPVATVIPGAHTAKLMTVKWKHLTNTTKYVVTVTSGSTPHVLPGASTKATWPYTINSNLSAIAGTAVRGSNITSGMFSFHLNQPAGSTKNFHGTYTFKVQAVYADKTTKSVGSANVTI